MKPSASPFTDPLTLAKHALGIPTDSAPAFRTRDDAPAALEQHRPSRAVDAVGTVVLVREDPSDPALLPLWHDLLDTSESPEKLYQSPAFFRFLKQRSEPGQFDLYSLRREGSLNLLGLVPVRRGEETVDFFSGRIPRLTATLKVIRILGSTALVNQDAALSPVVVRGLLERYPDVDAISMPSMPQQSGWNASLQQLDPTLAAVHVWHGWQVCHTIPLPDSFELYMKQFSAKKRYNITRQIKQLEQAAGAATVDAITRGDQVPGLLAAAKAVLGGALLSGWLSEASYRAMADQGLMLSYVIRCGGQPCGVVLGSTTGGVWHIHNIVGAPAYASLSIGTSVLHLALKHAQDTLQIRRIDLGYGKPNRDFSSHAIVQRGHVLVYRPSLRNRLLLKGHDRLRRTVAAAVPQLKALKKRIGEWGVNATKPAKPDSAA